MAAKKKISSEDLYLNRAKFVMKLLGVWMPPIQETMSEKAYRYFMMSLQYIFLLFQAIYIVQVWGDLDAVSQALYVIFTQACLCFKVTVFMIKTVELRDLLGRMNGDTFKPLSEKHEKFLETHASRIKRLLIFFMISSQLTCALWALKPLLDDAGSRRFPFDMWMPVKPDHSPYYELGYAFQWATISMSAYMYFGVDSVALSMVIFSCAQMDIVKDKILSIKSPPHHKGKERTTALKKSCNTLVECVIHHQSIISFTELVENSYQSYLLFQLVGSVGLICMSALRMLVVHWRSMQFLSIVTYLMVMTSQLFLCCWCGHELTASSIDFHTVLFQGPWYEQDLKFKRMLRFIMMRASKPLVFRAGYYFSLSRQTFVSILRTSYSYFAVLNQTT